MPHSFFLGQQVARWSGPWATASGPCFACKITGLGGGPHRATTFAYSPPPRITYLHTLF